MTQNQWGNLNKDFIKFRYFLKDGFPYLRVLYLNIAFDRWQPAQGRDVSKYRSRHLVANHKSSSQKDFGSTMDIDINIVNVNIDINFGQVPDSEWQNIAQRL